MFGFSSLATDLSALHPPQARGELLVQTYFDNIDPFVRVLHKPRFTLELGQFQRQNLPNPGLFECLLFAVYSMALVSLKTEDTIRLFGEDRPTMVARYRFATEQALARAQFLQSHEILPFQAFLLYIVSKVPLRKI